MMQQHVMAPQLLEQIAGFCRQAKLTRDEGFEFDLGMAGLLVNVEEARQIYGSVNRKHLPGFELEIAAQALDDFGVGVGFDFEAHGVAFAAVVQLGANRLEQVAGFFFCQVKVTVAGHAESGGGDDVVAVVHARRMEGN